MGKKNKSAFTITKDEVKNILQDPMVVKAPAYKSSATGNHIRTVEMDIVIGVDAKIGASLLAL